MKPRISEDVQTLLLVSVQVARRSSTSPEGPTPLKADIKPRAKSLVFVGSGVPQGSPDQLIPELAASTEAGHSDAGRTPS